VAGRLSRVGRVVIYLSERSHEEQSVYGAIAVAVLEWLPACPRRACHAAAAAACKNVTPWQHFVTFAALGRSFGLGRLTLRFLAV
jgi:hypothetical protein